jgi:hypothetical protein
MLRWRQAMHRLWSVSSLFPVMTFEFSMRYGADPSGATRQFALDSRNAKFLLMSGVRPT